MKGLKYLLFTLFFSGSFIVFSQETKMVKNRKKILAKQEEEKGKAQEKAFEEGRERHQNIQTKEVRKRMKKQAKKSEAYNRRRSGKKESFFVRVFRS
jgi:predicted nucleotide-binding protein (sugar kinase/HSP70/actin superfamily)